jgi:hypothetical protein
MKYDNNRLAGAISISHKGKNITTSVGSRRYESLYSGANVGAGLRMGNIATGYAHRPDLIANLFLGTPSQWWVICETNAIFDVFEQLKSGDVIRLPG